MSENILHLDDTSFEDAITKNKLIVIDFWAEWCGPCKMFASIFEEYAKENTDVVCAKVNVDQAPNVSNKYGIMSIPTIMIFKDGEIVKQQSGALPKQMLASLVNEVK